MTWWPWPPVLFQGAGLCPDEADQRLLHGMRFSISVLFKRSEEGGVREAGIEGGGERREKEGR